MEMGLQQANQNFSRLVRAIRAGQTVTLTDRGKPLAIVKPLARTEGKQLSRRAAIEAALDQLEAEGFISQRGTGRPMRQKGWTPIKLQGGKTMAETIIEEREDRA